MIGYKKGSSLVEVYTTAKISPVDNFKHGHGYQHGNTFC